MRARPRAPIPAKRSGVVSMRCYGRTSMQAVRGTRRPFVSFALFAASAALACCTICGCGKRPLEPRDPTPGVPYFRIATFNCDDKEESDPATIEAVGETGADVIALEEITPAWEANLRARYGKQYPYMAFRPNGAAGLAMLSIYPISEPQLLPAPNGFHPAWYTSVKTPAGWLRVLTVHLHSPDVGGLSSVSALQSLPGQHVEEMQDFTASAFDGGPTIVLGDFNEGPDGAAVSWLEDRGFDNALPLYHPGQFTWRHASVGNQFEQDLDHILFNGWLEPLNAYVIEAGNSDHIPVVALFQAPQAWPSP